MPVHLLEMVVQTFLNVAHTLYLLFASGPGKIPDRRCILCTLSSTTASGGDVFHYFCRIFPGSGWWEGGSIRPIPPPLATGLLIYMIHAIHVIRHCIAVLLYGLEGCSLSKSDLSSIDFTFNRFFMILFRTNNIEMVKVCQFFFGISLPSVVLCSRTDKFEQKFGLCADLVMALVWAAIMLPCCLCLFDFLFMRYYYVWWIKLNIYYHVGQWLHEVNAFSWDLYQGVNVSRENRLLQILTTILHIGARHDRIPTLLILAAYETFLLLPTTNIHHTAVSQSIKPGFLKWPK